MVKTQIKKKNILWIEDDQQLVDIYKETLKASGNFNVEFIMLGQLALNRIEKIDKGTVEKPDLIMLDLLLPDMNGEVILKKIRETCAVRNTPVYILTNYGNEKTGAAQTEKLNAEKYLIKTEWGPVKLISLIKDAMK